MSNNARAYSHYTRQAISLLAGLIKLYRKNLKMTAQDLAARAGISRSTLHKIERGDMKCEIGLVFEVAALVGLKFFDADKGSIANLNETVQNRIVLLPKNIRRRKVDDEF